MVNYIIINNFFIKDTKELFSNNSLKSVLGDIKHLLHNNY